MAPRLVIDSHIHLWPDSAANENGHAWMTHNMPLAKQHVLSDYCKASRQENGSDLDYVVEGVVYVETDRKYHRSRKDDLATWAKGPLEEINFVRSIVAGRYGERDGKMLLCIVLWAPMDQKPAMLREWLRLAEETAGSSTWKRVKGIRFLLQGMRDWSAFTALVLSEDFIDNLKLLGEKGFSFDIGVDQHSGGVWQLEIMAKAMQSAHAGVSEDKKVIFIMNHLCKPDFSGDTGDAHQIADSDFSPWHNAIEEMSKCSKTYMKLSGAFSELPSDVTSTAAIASQIKPWVLLVLDRFGASRVMFGSDWPVCNLNGPLGEGSWIAWKEVIETVLADSACRLSVQDRACIWRETAAKAYRLP